MRLNSKVTWGLAWTGLAVVLAVPSVDFLTGKLGKTDAAAVLTSDVDPVKTAGIEPAKTVTTIKTKNGLTIVPAGSKPPSADPADKVLSSGKPLPDYISDGKPAPAETQVASVDPVAPTPFPSWARPKVTPTPAAGAPVVTTPVVTAPVVAAPSTTNEPAPIVDESTLTGSIAEPSVTRPASPMADDSENWDTETLRQYLERRGVLEGSDNRSSARVTQRDTTYDPDGFYLNEGPNVDRSTRETRRERILRMLEESEDDSGGFTLF